MVLSHGMGNPLTWSLDTNELTLLEALVANGYDVWLQEWRSSTLLPTARTQFNGDQVAHLDHPAAAEVIASESGRRDLHLVTHCVGSLTWLMATLAGDVDPTSLFCSALGVHPVAPTLTRIKVGFHLGEILHRMGIQMLTTDSFTNESFLEHLFDRELRLYPIPKEEECDQAVCRRVAFIYGNAVHHVNLNPATHAALHELFGPSNLTMLGHLSLVARAEEALTASGKNDYLPHLERLQRPITFASGAHNLVWLPESTERTSTSWSGNWGRAGTRGGLRRLRASGRVQRGFGVPRHLPRRAEASEGCERLGQLRVRTPQILQSSELKRCTPRLRRRGGACAQSNSGCAEKDCPLTTPEDPCPRWGHRY